MRSTPRLAAVAQRLALVAAATLAATAAAELLLAVAGAATPEPPIYPGERVAADGPSVDPLIGWKLPPMESIAEETAAYSVTYRSNRQGFRARRDFALPTRKRRIALLGDSYTMGSGVEDDQTFAHLLQRRLRKTQSYNFGIGGFGVDQMWLTLRHYALPTEPDLVVLSFIRPNLPRALSAYRMGHDWLAKPTFRLAEGELVPMTLETRPGTLRRFAERHSRLLEIGRRLDYSLGRRFAFGYTWRLNRALFERVRDDCRAAGVPLVVMHIPVNRRHPAPLFEREFADMEIPFLDLSHHLPPDADRLYHRLDPHLNAAGHHFAADTLAAFLIERGYARAAPGPRASPD